MKSEKSKIGIIGAGFSGLSAACYLANAGYSVDVFEKNEAHGGRARQFKTDNGYLFDMGPSWYWMPDVFERFFNDFGYEVEQLYELKQLDPAFEIVFGDGEVITVPAAFSNMLELFESLEQGSAEKLLSFMRDAEFKYKHSMEKLIYKPGLSLSEFADFNILGAAWRLQLFTSFRKHVRKYFSHPKLIMLMEFPVLFLGGSPDQIPALYSLMNFAAFRLGTWYPMGGFGKVSTAMRQVAETCGARFHFDSEVEKIVVKDAAVDGIVINGQKIDCDAVISSADYAHTEKRLLSPNERNYEDGYWENKTLAPSCLIYYLGITKRLQRLKHHTLFFQDDLSDHFASIYDKPGWPSNPSFYVCRTSATDDKVCPEGHDNLFLLMPIAPGVEDNEEMREKFFHLMLSKLEKFAGEPVFDSIDFKKSYCVNNFLADYHAYKGNAYGLANTLLQTAVLKPKIRNMKVRNLFYAGQFTVPGPGVPPCIISGKIAAEQVMKQMKNKMHEVII